MKFLPLSIVSVILVMSQTPALAFASYPRAVSPTPSTSVASQAGLPKPMDSPAKLQPEDIIRIQVFNQTQLLLDTPVGADGYISAPYVGNILAEGKTTQQLAEELTGLFRKTLYLRDPIVSVTIISFRQLHATVGGLVQRPGTYNIRKGDTLINLLNQGGGVVPDQSDLRRCTLRHANSDELIPIDLYALLNRGDLSQNYVLKDGDEFNVPTENNNRILVLGAIQTPGAFPYHEPTTLADAIALAHGELPLKSRFSKVVVTRQRPGQPGQYIRIHADFTRFIREGDQTQNILLQPGDLVYVPQTNTPDYGEIAALVNVIYIFGVFNTNVLGVNFH